MTKCHKKCHKHELKSGIILKVIIVSSNGSKKGVGVIVLVIIGVIQLFAHSSVLWFLFYTWSPVFYFAIIIPGVCVCVCPCRAIRSVVSRKSRNGESSLSQQECW